MPNRIIKESICTSDKIDSLKWFEEIVFYRLIVNCDDYGRMDARPAIIKAKLFPLKDGVTKDQVSNALNSLASAGMVQVYEYDHKPYLQILGWGKHQTVRNKRSKYPSPADGNQAHNCKNNADENTCMQMYANVPVIQSNPIQSESISESESETACAYAETLKYCEKVFGIISPRTHDAIIGYLDDGVEPEMIRAAVDDAVDAGKVSWKYTSAILNNKVSSGIRTLEAFRRSEAEFKAKQDAVKTAPHVKPSKFNNYEDTNRTDYADLENKLFDMMLEDGGETG